MIAATPEPPYWSVIFTSVRTTEDDAGYAVMAEAMERLAWARPGFLGLEAARQGVGITVSYWADEASILGWRRDVEHLAAQRLGRERWYAAYRLRVARVERDYGFSPPA